MGALPVHFIGAGAGLPPGGAESVGGKAFNLARMADAGLPVPPAFVLPTCWCRALRDGSAGEAAVAAALDEGIARLEAATGLGFGGGRRPLLVSVRSGAAVSMPGMMETVLDVGLNPAGVEGLLRLTGNPRLAWDSWRRLLQGYAEVVQGLPVAPFDELLAAAQVSDFDTFDYRELVRQYATTAEAYKKIQETIPLHQDFVDCQLRWAAENVKQLGELAGAIGLAGLVLGMASLATQVSAQAAPGTATSDTASPPLVTTRLAGKRSTAVSAMSAAIRSRTAARTRAFSR